MEQLKHKKVEHPRDITRKNITLWPVTNQTDAYTYKVAQVISSYLKPLCKNEFTINGAQRFSQEVLTLPRLKQDTEDVSYDVDRISVY